MVHSSVIFTAPQAPMCLPVAALYTHAHEHTNPNTHTYTVQASVMCAHIDYSLQRNPVTVQLPFCFVIGQLTSAPSFVFSSFPPLSVCSSQTVYPLDRPPDPTCRHQWLNQATNPKTENLTYKKKTAFLQYVP